MSYTPLYHVCSLASTIVLTPYYHLYLHFFIMSIASLQYISPVLFVTIPARKYNRLNHIYIDTRLMLGIENFRKCIYCVLS